MVSGSNQITHLNPYRIALLYLVLSAAWILFSDQLLLLVMANAPGESLILAQTIKGWAFVFLSSFLIWVLVRRLVNVLMDTRSNLQLSQAVLERTHNGIMITAADQTILYVNDAFTRITGFPADEVLGQTPRILSSGFHDRDFYRDLWAALENQSVWQGEIVNRRRDGSLFTEWITITRVTSDTVGESHYVSVISDISEQKAGQERLRYMAYYDPLTELPNRAYSHEELHAHLKRSAIDQTRIATLFVDIANFRLINESMGHEAGDELLRVVASRIRSKLTPMAFLGRFSGDIYVIYLPYSSVQAIAHLAEQIMAGFEAPVRLETGRTISLQASIGIALGTGKEVGSEEEVSLLLSRTDSALNEAKRRGKNTYAFYSRSLTEEATQRLELEHELRIAIAEGQLRLHYQPVFSVDSGTLLGAEALVRWHHPEKGLISPGDFIPLAEDTGLIVPLGQWVMKEAAMQARRWLDQGLAPGTIAFNVSSQQLKDTNVAAELKSLLREIRLEPHFLEVELTESGLMQAETLESLRSIRELGVQLAIDDFGTGYSSLAYLRRFPVQKLKVDRSFINDIIESEETFLVVKSIIAMSQALGLTVQAEGVEVAAQINALEGLGCDQFQGFLKGKPVAADLYESQHMQ